MRSGGGGGYFSVRKGKSESSAIKDESTDEMTTMSRELESAVATEHPKCKADKAAPVGQSNQSASTSSSR